MTDDPGLIFALTMGGTYATLHALVLYLLVRLRSLAARVRVLELRE